MIKFLVLFLVTFNLYASECRVLAKRFIKGQKKIEVTYIDGRRFRDHFLIATYRNIQLGILTYDKVEDGIFISLVVVEEPWRKLGVQTILHDELIKLENPHRIQFSIGETNKARYLYGIRAEMFGEGPELIDSMEQNRIVEAYLYAEHSSIHHSVLRGAVAYTPAYRTLSKLGFKLKDVEIKTHNQLPSIVNIKLAFERGE